MLPSEIREQILAEHGRVRPLLDTIEAAARKVVEGGADEVVLKEHVRELEQVLCRILDEERELLHPELRRTDAWGDVRAKQLDRSHREQRALLARTREEAEGGFLDPRKLAERLLHTVAAIRADLRKEEQRFLSPDLLRDDLVTVGQTDG